MALLSCADSGSSSRGSFSSCAPHILHHSPTPIWGSGSCSNVALRGACGRRLFISSYVFLCWRAAFQGWFRLTAMWKLESMWWWEGSAAHSRLNLDPALAFPTPSDFNQRIESVQLQTWKENGVTNVGQLPMHHGTGNLAEQHFSFIRISI